MKLEERRRAAARLIAENRDLLDARPDTEAAERVARARGWDGAVLGLSDEELARHETDGPCATWRGDAPSALRSLADASRETCRLEALLPARPPEAARARRHETPRKQAQIDAFVRAIEPLAARSRRILDVGCGHGHLGRALAAAVGRPVVGLERDCRLASKARRLAERTNVVFDVTDVLRDGLALGDDDCVVGLHACGELGDAIVTSAAKSGAAIALVGCCLQKRRQEVRSPLADARAFGQMLDLPRVVLGLSNLTARAEGVEASRVENLAARERRLALHRLLSASGEDLAFGAEIAGLNRRAAHLELDALVARAFALRERPVPGPAAIAEAAAWARATHARARRLALPRSLLARVIEVFVLLDRACHLEAHGMRVTLGTLFDASVSARNLALLASA